MGTFVKCLLIALLGLQAGCGQGFRASAWNHTARECREAEDYGNGLWTQGDFCRDGKGVVVWSMWVF